MLKSLSLKYFRRHENLNIDFARGLNTLRGANEAGKTTILESILYSLYGSRTLRSSLAETVTRGMQEKDLKVVLVLSMQGKDITFERSKAGAQVLVNGQVFVTGQNEVTAYATELLGADAKTAGMLMMAGQADLRGALAEGPAAVSALIGKLADFDLIDKILESAQANLLLGADAQLRSRLSTYEADLLAGEQAAPVDNSAQILAAADADDVVLKGLYHEAQTVLMPAADQAAVALSALQDAARQRVETERALASADAEIKATADRLAQVSAVKRPAAQDMEAARQAVTHAQSAARVASIYAKVVALPPFPPTVWEGSRESFDQEIKRLEAEANQAKQDQAVLGAEINVLLKQKITSGKCPTCGHAAVSDTHVSEHNLAIDGRIGPVEDRRMDAVRRASQAANSLKVMNDLANLAKPFVALAPLVAEDLGTVDSTTYPPKITWTAGVAQSASLPQAQARVAELERQEQAALRAEGEVATLDAQLVRQRAARGSVEAKLVACPVVDLAPAQAAVEAATAALRAKQKEASDLAMVVHGLRQDAKAVQEAVARHAITLEGQRNRIKELKEDLENLSFNNALMAKLRKLKPAITDHLWSIVLSSVSTFFSQLRGQVSVVSKDSTGFKVDGYGIESLSGSTLDALAIAVRVALTLTFIPHAPFLVLDEPAHGCDRNRTSNILGFLASTGVPQLLIASHDELSESVADHVISIGA